MVVLQHNKRNLIHCCEYADAFCILKIMNTIYANFIYRFWFWCKAHRTSFRRNKIIRIENGVIAVHNRTYGVFNAKLRFVKQSLKTRGNAHQRVPKVKKSDIKFIDKDVIFIGGIMPHFGHFMLEHFCRAHALLNMDLHDKSVVLVDYKGVNNVPDFIYELLRLIGVPKDRIIIINNTTKFRNVYLPTQSFDMYRYTSKEYGQVFDKIYANIKQSSVEPVYDKVYMSRTKMGDRRVIGEEKIEKIFARNGWHIIYPETLALKDQARIVGGCKMLAGGAGTALHLALFMKNGGTVISIKRNRKTKDNANTQNLINITKGLNGVYVAGAVEVVKSDHWCEMPQIIGMTKYMQMFMKDFGIKYNASDLNMNKSDWNTYNRLLNEYNMNHHRKTLVGAVKNKMVKILACFIPGRDNRARFRNFMKSKIK